MSRNKNVVETKEEDFLTPDQSIPGQNYVCLSFVSPEKYLKQKQVYKLLHFLKEKCNIEKTYEELNEEYKSYLVNADSKLEKNFYEENNFHTSVRGLKIRGVYDTQREAKMRAKTLRKLDVNHNVFVGQVGFWLPWDPEPFDVQEMEYMETELNTLMKSKKENEMKKNLHFQQEKQARVEDAMKHGKDVPKDNFEEGLYKDDPWSKKQQEKQSNSENETTVDSTTTTETKDETTKNSNELTNGEKDELSEAIKKLET